MNKMLAKRKKVRDAIGKNPEATDTAITRLCDVSISLVRAERRRMAWRYLRRHPTTSDARLTQVTGIQPDDLVGVREAVAKDSPPAASKLPRRPRSHNSRDYDERAPTQDLDY